MLTCSGGFVAGAVFPVPQVGTGLAPFIIEILKLAFEADKSIPLLQMKESDNFRALQNQYQPTLLEQDIRDGSSQQHLSPASE